MMTSSLFLLQERGALMIAPYCTAHAKFAGSSGSRLDLLEALLCHPRDDFL
jgi:hypothetical protein